MHRAASSLIALTLSAAAFQPRKHHFVSKAVARHIGSRRGVSLSAASGPAYCEVCGSKTTVRIPEGDERERHVCTSDDCGHVSYRNPKVVVGAVCTTHDGRVLLCKRAIEPCAGKWGYPQGFLELGETTRQGAARETWEEAGVRFDPAESELLAIYNLAGVQIQMIYRAELETDDCEPGHESSDVMFVPWDDVPWDELAFPTVAWGLEHARDTRHEDKPPIQERTKHVTMDGKWKVEEG